MGSDCKAPQNPTMAMLLEMALATVTGQPARTGCIRGASRAKVAASMVAEATAVEVARAAARAAATVVVMVVEMVEVEMAAVAMVPHRLHGQAAALRASECSCPTLPISPRAPSSRAAS